MVEVETAGVRDDREQSPGEAKLLRKPDIPNAFTRVVVGLAQNLPDLVAMGFEPAEEVEIAPPVCRDPGRKTGAVPFPGLKGQIAPGLELQGMDDIGTEFFNFFN